jgi:hypothetical protein
MESQRHEGHKDSAITITLTQSKIAAEPRVWFDLVRIDKQDMTDALAIPWPRIIGDLSVLRSNCDAEQVEQLLRRHIRE